MLSIKNLHASVEGKEILKGINLEIKAGEVHAIMGPNGSGKSTLSQVLAGNDAFEVTSGEVSSRLAGAVYDAALAQVIGSQLNLDLVSGQDADVVLAHFS